jgi:hypothetical protein
VADGYQAVNAVRIRLRDLPRLGALVRRIIDTGDPAETQARRVREGLGPPAGIAHRLGLDPGLGPGRIVLRPATRSQRDPNGSVREVADGYQAVNAVRIRLRDLPRLGALVPAAGRPPSSRRRGPRPRTPGPAPRPSRPPRCSGRARRRAYGSVREVADGYQAVNAVRIRLRDLPRLGALVRRIIDVVMRSTRPRRRPAASARVSARRRASRTASASIPASAPSRPRHRAPASRSSPAPSRWPPRSR